ncbi:MAG: Gfo/Idh/MocA family oxidoreductase [Planctomycetes bacterium]|nr:Gfo/Idh/MocA family oxidoreductase [Planctomycetota bacterium]MCH9723379.1 Gfo/Idh/MocA family oxidoreductase [Planctomycetota bacterium]MCH9779046.1 Gfo/Idh/MocA family oxidoreductase [Planctomycetota bacterium]MCH9793555.1 Gfo/Idh/MocA family oxidoreductase [Planctomycetota bacterium]
MDRRKFLQGSALGLASVSLEQVAKASASERVRVGMIGASGRASALNQYFAANSNSEIVAIAEIDTARQGKTLETVTKIQGKQPQVFQDFRKLLDNNSLDAIVVGTPDHWHAIPTILACQAGKDVYVEKPDGHNIIEGQRMVAAMNKHKRIVQMGSQHRSTDRLKSALDYIRTGALGRCLVAKAWESTRQGNIGYPPDSTPPETVDYDMWLGPAKKRPFNKNRFHGRWRWFHDYGTGDLGNDGVHRLDMAFAALNAACEAQKDDAISLPTKISAMGGKWYFDDMQEWPDTLQVNYEYTSKTPKILTYEMRVWAPYQFHGESEGAVIYGDKGYMVIGNSRWRVYANGGRLTKEVKGNSDAAPHVQNFLDCIKTRKKPACDLETVGHPASVLCHAGNIAARVGRTLTLDPQTELFLNDNEANQLRGREEWRKPWILPEV